MNEAWIGDAVLSLYARSRILRETGKADGLILARLTSNQFLAAFGEPTKVEAAIGRAYEQGGLQQAYDWIEHTLIPLFLKQEENRSRKNTRR